MSTPPSPNHPRWSWTREEQHQLRKAYYDRLPGVCPVCGAQVSMRPEMVRGERMLLIRCWSCGNRALVEMPG